MNPHMDIKLGELWTVAVVLLGFQVGAFSWRLAREIAVAASADIVWFPPAEFVNLLAILCNCVGVFVLPLAGVSNADSVRVALGISVLLFAGYPFALAGHYDLFVPGERSMAYFTKQEKVAIALIVVAVLLFVVFQRPF
jgi:hypothetical protein